MPVEEQPSSPDNNGVNMEDPFGNEKKSEETPAPAPSQETPPASGDAPKQ